MKKENRKKAQERKAAERKRNDRNKFLKKLVIYGVPILLAAAFIIFLIVVGVKDSKKKSSDASSSTSSAETTVTDSSTDTGDTTSTDSTSETTAEGETTTAYIDPDYTNYGSGTLDTDTSLTVETGDTVNIDYTGYKDGVAFDGGSTDGAGADLTIGTNTYIDGFESGLIGHNVGETVELNLTFPENYQVEDLAGQDVVFEVTINGIYK